MIKVVFFGLIEGLLRNISGPLGRKLRYLYYKHRFASCGENVHIDEGVIFEKPEFMYIGKNVWIGANSVVLPGAYIGDNAVVAAGSVVDTTVEPNSLVAGNPIHLVKRLK